MGEWPRSWGSTKERALPAVNPKEGTCMAWLRSSEEAAGLQWRERRAKMKLEVGDEGCSGEDHVGFRVISIRTLQGGWLQYRGKTPHVVHQRDCLQILGSTFVVVSVSLGHLIVQFLNFLDTVQQTFLGCFLCAIGFN